MSGNNKKLGYKSLTECVRDDLKEKLVNGELKPGEEINFASLCETLGVSRTPVREALIQLIKDGFIEGATRRGFRIKQFSPVEIRDLYEIGGLLEGEIVKSACDKITDGDIRKLEGLLQRIETALAENDADAYLERNGEFNALLWDFCENSTLNEFSEKVRERLYFAKKRLDCPEWNRMLLADHREIIRHLKARDKTALETFLREQHWSFSRWLPFIRQFYKFSDGNDSRE